jgi:hypothetical protein
MAFGWRVFLSRKSVWRRPPRSCWPLRRANAALHTAVGISSQDWHRWQLRNTALADELGSRRHGSSFAQLSESVRADNRRNDAACQDPWCARAIVSRVKRLGTRPPPPKGMKIRSMSGLSVVTWRMSAPVFESLTEPSWISRRL